MKEQRQREIEIDPAIEWVLRRWGRVYGVPAESPEWDEHPLPLGPGGSLLGRALERAQLGMVIRNPDDSLWAPDAFDRCHTLGAHPAAPPCDRVTARGKESPPAPRRFYPDRVADSVDALVLELGRISPIRAIVMRCEFCLRGPRREKVEAASERAGIRISRKRYRWELENGILWIKPRALLLAAEQ